MKRIGSMVTSLALLFSLNLYAQMYTVSLPSLSFPTDAGSLGMGSAAGAIATDNPFSFFVNPAHIGIRAFDKEITYGNSYSNWITTWYGCKTNLTNNAAIAGISLRTFYPTAPDLAFGVGYGKTKWEYSFFPYGANQLGHDKYDYFTVGVGYNNYIKIAAGLTVKKIESQLASGSLLDALTYKGEGTVYDWGFSIVAPLADLIPTNQSTVVYKDIRLAPIVNWSFGFSELNTGANSFSYTDSDPGSRLPRMAVGSMGITLACAVTRNSVELKPVEFNWQLDVRSLLGIVDSLKIEYNNWPGEINFLKNVLLGQSSEKLMHSKGWELNFCETFIISGGRYHESSNYGGRDYSTNTAWGIRFAGLVKMARMAGVPINDNTTWGYIINHLDVGYNYSKIETADPYSGLNGVDYRDITFRFRL